MKRFLAILAAGLTLCACDGQSRLPAETQISEVFNAAHRAGKFDGAVLVLRDGAAIFERGFGFSDRSTDRRFSLSTPIPIASLSKPFTAVVILQLVEQGRLRLDERLDAVFPDLIGQPSGAITVAQLLSHTSGIEEITEHHRERPLIPADLMSAKIESPGAYKYSSSGFVVLKLVAEAVSGNSFADLLKSGIFEPAGMENSGLIQNGLPIPALALAYPDGTSGTAIAPSVPFEILEGAGSMYSSVRDLQRFDDALTQNRLLSAATQATMNSNHTPSGTPWGYGWSLGEQSGKLFPYHRGDYAGFHGVLVRQINRRELVVILSNVDKADISALQRRTLRILKRTSGVSVANAISDNVQGDHMP